MRPTWVDADADVSGTGTELLPLVLTVLGGRYWSWHCRRIATARRRRGPEKETVAAMMQELMLIQARSVPPLWKAARCRKLSSTPAVSPVGSCPLAVLEVMMTLGSFPRGKKNKDEEDHACAIREVLEETGFEVSNLLDKDEFIEMIFGQQKVRSYVIAGVKEDTSFAPQTKKEISEIAWHHLDKLQPALEIMDSGSSTLSGSKDPSTHKRN
ncbi:hypothetical protein MLD38_009814 [Melastoma candidum]|uniref:Uncharacterized protein n=1 Tax=Melastoma candidum TaxID=119954 RepID=A0ACB9RYF5_9MYRT|nr:hypothetical protein MLD38_009814 [Melastoma candidum]